MSKVHILPPDVISKIAAGEVVERPASVIKELMENAIDAGAKSIEVELIQAGKTSIVIRDSGSGIAQDDIETIFARHSTSKISSAEDLFNIHSLGFRGEALYSISAIADVILRSKTQEQDSGWEIHVRGGEKLGLKPVTMNTGTEIEVQELFFNTPARRKFLKTNTTEMNQIIDTFVPYALLCPEVRFALTHQNKSVLELESTESLTGRIAAALNVSTDHLIEAGQEYPEENISFKLVLGDINIARTRRDLQFVFINGRPVQNKAVSFHLNDVYRLILPPGNFPFFAAFITMPPDLLDVNIHPTKREVKIKNEQTVTSLLRHLTEAALMKAGGIKQAADSPSLEPTDIERALRNTNRIEKVFEGNLPADIFQPLADPAEQAPTEQYSFPTAPAMSMVGESLYQQKQDSLQSKLERSRYIGPLLDKFLLFEADRSLLVIDQHAAQERITYEHLIKQMQNSSVEVQRLLSPYQIKLTVKELGFWEESKEKLNTIGFETTQFDNETIAVHTYPVLVGEPDRAVRELLAGGGIARTDHETIARRACKASVRAGDALHSKQAEFQREALLACRDPFTCPHGRPTVIEMTEGFLDKQFLRT